MDPFILADPWIPLFWPVHGCLYSDRSMNPYIKIGPRNPIFWTVHGSIYADRPMNPYIKIGPWIPTFWPIRESLYSHRSVDLYIHRGPWIPIFLIGPWIPLFEAFGQLLNMTHHLILESIWLIPLSLSPHYHKYESYYMTLHYKSHGNGHTPCEISLTLGRPLASIIFSDRIVLISTWN